jgi:hypothetical protein
VFLAWLSVVPLVNQYSLEQGLAVVRWGGSLEKFQYYFEIPAVTRMKRFFLDLVPAFGYVPVELLHDLRPVLRVVLLGVALGNYIVEGSLEGFLALVNVAVDQVA